MATTTEETPLRSTGNMERFNITRNRLNFYNNIQVSATYTLPCSIITTHSLLPTIQSALSLTIQKQPILSVTIQDEETKEPKWKRSPTINLEEMIKTIEVDEKTSHDDWITAGHRTRLDQVDELPLWRIILAVPSSAPSKEEGEAYSFVLAFYVHHAIADGLSATAFHTTFLSSLNTLLLSPHLIKLQPLITIPYTPLIDNLELRTKLPISTWFAVKKIFEAYIYTFPSPSTYTGPPIRSTPPESPPVSSLLTFSLQREDVKNIVGRCRQQKTTVTSILTVLVAQYLGRIHGPEYTRFVGAIPFSIRKWTKHSPNEMGCFVSGVSPLFSSEPSTPKGYISCKDGEGLWEAARETRKFVERETRSETNQTVGLLKFVSDVRGFFLGRLGGKREHSFEVTNVGVVDGNLGGEGGNARFDNMIFSSALCTYGEPYCVSVVGVKGGAMTVGVNWVIGVTEDENARGLSAWLEESLREVAEGFVDGDEVYEARAMSERDGVEWVWAAVGLVGAVAAGWWWWWWL